MNPTKTYTTVFFLALIALMTSSCSTKKKTWFHRQYHNTSAKYNGYFNGNESIKNGIRKLHEKHTDDYTAIIPVFPTGDLKKSEKTAVYMDRAVKKGSVVIQRHSIKIKGKEYCKWIDDNYLLVGKAYFYKGDFVEAIKTFRFIKSEYKKNDIYFDASVWLCRSYVEKRDFALAKTELEELFKNKKFPNRLNTNLSLVAADYYIKTQDLNSAAEELKRAAKEIKRKRKKARLNYILAQIYQYSNNYSLAQEHYELVLKSNPDYEMAFSAKMNLARSLETGNPDTKKIRARLLKMVKDEKNKEYLDQIYFTIAEMDVSSQDTASAIANYILSANNSIENNSQKALSFLALAEIYFSEKLYKPADTYYDSTIFYMQTNFRLYDETYNTHLVLSELVKNINIVERQDSLQTVSKLPRDKQIKLVNTIISKKIEKERKEQEAKTLQQQAMYENRINGGLGDQFGNKTSGGKWYFYNPATLSFGLSEFRKKWGNRKLEDDWRRKNKNTLAESGLDKPKTDASFVAEQNKNTPNYYLNQLPKTPEDFIRSNEKIKTALYQQALIYNEDLNEMVLSVKCFEEIFNRFPEDDQLAPLSLYNCYIILKELKDFRAENIAGVLKKKYPNSIYAKIIDPANEGLNTLTKIDSATEQYTGVFDLYQKEMFGRVISSTDTISNKKHQDKLLLLRAFSLIKTNQLERAAKTLKKISNREEKTFEEAQHVLQAINDPSQMNKENELASAGSRYLYRPKSKHMLIIVLPKKGVDITYLKTLISDFHRQKISNEVFEISALLLGLDQHLLMIKDFSNRKEAIEYYNLFLVEKTLQEVLTKSEHMKMLISRENFTEFYKNKDVDGYYNFFIKNY